MGYCKYNYVLNRRFVKPFSAATARLCGRYSQQYSARPRRSVSQAGAFFFTVATTLALHILLLRSDPVGYQFGQSSQVLPPEMTPAGRDDNERVRRYRVGPTGWKRAQRTLGILELDSIFAPVVAIDDQFILLAEERMEWVRHPKRWSPTALIRCIRQLAPTASRSSSRYAGFQ